MDDLFGWCYYQVPAGSAMEAVMAEMLISWSQQKERNSI